MLAKFRIHCCSIILVILHCQHSAIAKPLQAAAASLEVAEQPSGSAKESTPVPPKPASEPISPTVSLAKIHVPEGFRVELVACEPQTIDPVAFDWDAAGRLWVVEMADYPLGMDGKGKAGGRVRVLEDKDHDGHYETSRLFADSLNFPNGIMTWRDGVLVTAAPQLLYLRDTDGDGVADTHEVLFEGFNEGNQQLRMNHLRWGLDGWLYCANGGHHANHGLGTKVQSTRNGKSYEIGSRDFRFNPDSGDLELESGPSQFGRNRDAYGRWFGTQNANPLWHYVLPDRYLARNPYVATASAIKHVVGPNSPKVYPASPLEKRFHSFEQSGRFTSACSGMIFGDNRLFGVQSKFIHAFTCEPFHNLVQHNLLTDEGVSFASERPAEEGDLDFFASEDRWCRPVMVRTGPDGGLWVADMYRYMIEHPDWLPPEGKAELLPHYRLGDDRGRIYRVIPASHQTTEWKLNKDDLKTLVAGIDSPNDWQRDKCHQLLVWSRNLDAVPLLEQLIKSSSHAATRVQAMWILEGFQHLHPSILHSGLSDPDPRVRENAIRMAERRTDAETITAACRLAGDQDPKVCLQLALTLGQWNNPAADLALVTLATRFPESPLMISAVMSSVLLHTDHFVELIAKADSKVLAAYREPLMRQSLAKSDARSISRLLASIVSVPEDQRMVVVDEFLQTLQSTGSSVDSLRGFQSQYPIGKLLDQVEETLVLAEKVASNESRAESIRFQAAKLLCRSTKHQPIGIRLIAQWLRPQSDPRTQLQAVQVLGQSANAEVPTVLVSAWPELTPDLRIAAIDAWLSREPWTRDLLDRIESKTVAAASLTLQQRNRLIRNPSGQIAEKAAQLFEQFGQSTRKEVVDRYRESLTLPGDVARGKAVFMKACANCHRRGNEGHEVGPNLATVVSHSPEKLLTNILDPNADIQPGYQSYSCLLETGEILVGLLASETANSLTIKQANGVERSVPRREIEKLLNSNISFMPEGVEATVTLQEMADLLKFLKE
jgi:putative membrane-bound dehydrogenase-like protein